MVPPNRLITAIGIVIAISLASTVIALSLQSYLGRLPFLALLGQVLAAIGATAFALNGQRGRQNEESRSAQR
jgi:hypothetical protein